jgi:hypothetical protein
MKRHLPGIAGAVLIGAALLSAQATPPTGAPSPALPGSTGTAGKPQTTIYTGCLAAGSTADTYILSNVTTTDAKAAKSKSQPGSAAGSTTASPAPSYALMGAPANFDMKRNLNHKVQITGTLTEFGAAGATPTPAASPAPAGSANPEAAGSPTAVSPGTQSALQTLIVRSAKVLADTCQ